jgi:hypothetical protein
MYLIFFFCYTVVATLSSVQLVRLTRAIRCSKPVMSAGIANALNFILLSIMRLIVIIFLFYMCIRTFFCAIYCRGSRFELPDLL